MCAFRLGPAWANLPKDTRGRPSIFRRPAASRSARWRYPEAEDGKPKSQNQKDRHIETASAHHQKTGISIAQEKTEKCGKQHACGKHHAASPKGIHSDHGARDCDPQQDECNGPLTHDHVAIHWTNRHHRRVRGRIILRGGHHPILPASVPTRVSVYPRQCLSASVRNCGDDRGEALGIGQSTQPLDLTTMHRLTDCNFRNLAGLCAREVRHINNDRGHMPWRAGRADR